LRRHGPGALTIKSPLRSAATGSRTESSYLLKPNLSTNYPIVDRGEGPYLFDTDGRRYFDGSAAAMTANLGHGLREIAERNAATA
jgi:adenosylmethionine-8-amino-7-oxononanoate aminotransferase